MTLWNIPYAVWIGIWFVVGLFAGRFANRCIVRLPFRERIIASLRYLASKEERPRCYPAAKWYHWLPIIGTARMLGRSPYSGRRILSREPWIELLCGLLFALFYWYEIPASGVVHESCLATTHGPGLLVTGWADSLTMLHVRYLFHLILIVALVIATFIDFDYMIIPDGVTRPTTLLGFLFALIFGTLWIYPVWFRDPHRLSLISNLLPENWQWLFSGNQEYPLWIFDAPHWHGLAVALAGYIVGRSIILAVRVVAAWVLRREAMGFGDVILMEMIGCFIGWQAVIVVFFIAPVIALVSIVGVSLINLIRFRPMLPSHVPYGPFLSGGTLVTLLFWDKLFPFTDGIFSMGILVPILGAVLCVFLYATLQALQLLKRLIGISPYEVIVEEQWTSADQLAHFAGETIDTQHGSWRTTSWNGTHSGRGLQANNQWKGRP